MPPISISSGVVKNTMFDGEPANGLHQGALLEDEVVEAELLESNRRGQA